MIKVKVPATSANMGSGFDSIGIALTLANEIGMEESDRLEIKSLNGDDIPTDESNLIYQCAKKVYDICGKTLKGMKIVERCNIPQTRGLGSSSACTVAGLLGANELLGKPMSEQNIIDLAASIEGHPDNSTPAILGGFVVALQEYGKVWHVRVPIYGRLDFVAFIPNFELKTSTARPKTIAHHDAVFNLSRAALLAGSLVTGDLQNIGVAVGDKLHQPYRYELIPNGREIAEAARRDRRARRVSLRRGPDHYRHRGRGRQNVFKPCADVLRGKLPGLEARPSALRRVRRDGDPVG